MAARRPKAEALGYLEAKTETGMVKQRQTLRLTDRELRVMDCLVVIGAEQATATAGPSTAALTTKL